MALVLGWAVFFFLPGGSALLLASDTRIRFKPDAKNGTPAALDMSFRAWDGTLGKAGGTADVSHPTTSGGITAFSSDLGTATITVTSVSDAPVLDNSADMALTAIDEDDITSGGELVSAVIASAGGDRITDVDSGDSEGIAVTSVDNTNGIWQYSMDGGTTWIDFVWYYSMDGGKTWKPFAGPNAAAARSLLSKMVDKGILEKEEVPPADGKGGHTQTHYRLTP